ncbi:brain acid soluble protein 1-like [Sorghum bicolor]|uniref:brain acid soluble protein 1-like n=1 Tax=Sorghum bicolor TaxID=4558 RepID=UPI000B425617|nr:brain acid soluble protein 1-like [Sorghum bicolor]|eukprot:XP_021307316.1 brain acid soluble protein 1-like [Sorghum bicolor]
MAADPSPAEALPAESSQAPKHRRLVRIIDDDDEEEEAPPSLVRRPRSRPDTAPATTDQVASDPPAPRVAETGVQAPTGRTRRRFTATHRRSDLAASDVNPDQVAEQRTAEPVAAVGDTAPQATEQPAAATATTSAGEQPAPAALTAAPSPYNTHQPIFSLLQHLQPIVKVTLIA